MALQRALAGAAVPDPAAIESAIASKVPVGDEFAGQARKAAKLSIGTGQKETFKDLQALVNSLKADEAMITHQPPIGTDASSARVTEEQRNVSVAAFLYASSRESDNDFHLIVGQDPTAPEVYMTMEVSGLPVGQGAPAFKTARDAFKGFFGAKLPAFSYDFYDPPIPVKIEGSLFFDMTHATGQHPGPPSLKSRMPTIWEVHPVTAITLG